MLDSDGPLISGELVVELVSDTDCGVPVELEVAASC